MRNRIREALANCGPPTLVSRRILVVDDDEALNHLAQKVLQRSGFETHGVLTGAEALARVLADPELTLLLDHKLLDMDGTELMRTLIEQGRCVPFVAMTGQGNEQIAVEMMKLGAREYLTKDSGFIDLLPEVFHRVFRELETERRLTQAEQAEAEAEARYRGIFENAVEGIVQTGLDGTVMLVNPALARLYGYDTPEQFMAELPTIVSVYVDIRDRERFLAELLEKGRVDHFEVQLRRRDGNIVWSSLNARLVKDAEGRPLHISGSVQDINERKRAEQALLESRNLYRTLVENLPLSIMTFDQAGRIDFVNQYHLDTFARGKMGKEFFLGRKIDELPGVASSGVGPKLKPLLEGQPVYLDGEFIPQLSGGGSGWQSIRGIPLCNDGLLAGGILMREDISERKEAEQALKEYVNFLESLDRLERAIRKAPDMERMMSDALDVVLEVMEVDRAWVVYPFDPDTEFFNVPMERTRPEWPGALALGVNVPLSPELREQWKRFFASEEPVAAGPGGAWAVTQDLRESFSVQTYLAMALHPKIDRPWQFGVHQCSHERVWTGQEKALFKAMGGRISDALNSLVYLRSLRESEARYRVLYQNTPAMLHSMNREGRLAYVSDTWCEKLGYTREEVLGRSILDFLTKDSIVTALEVSWPRFYATGYVEDIPYRFVTKDGRVLDILLSAKAERDADGAIARSLAVLTDVTEKKRAEEALRESEARTRALFNATSDSAILMDTKGVILAINEHGARRRDLQPGEMIGKVLCDYLPSDNAETRRTKAREVIETGEPVSFEEERVGRYYLLRMYPVFDQENKVIQLASFSRDITEQKRAQESLAQSEEKFRTVADFTYDWEYWLGPDGRMVWNSPSCELVTGYTAEEFVSDPDLLRRIVHPEDRAMFDEHQHDIETGSIESCDMDFRILHSSGQIVWINHYCVDIARADGTPLGRRASNRDITARKKAESKLTMELALTKAMSELSTALIAKATTFQDIADITLHYSKLLTQSEHGFVAVIEPKTGGLVSYTLTQMMGRECQVEAGQARITFPCNPDGQYPKLWGHALNQRQPFYTNGPGSHPASSGTPAGHIPLMNFLAVPALIGDKLIGLIALSNSPDGYADRDLAVVQRLADLYAVAIDRQATVTALRTSEQQIRGLFNSTTDSVMLLDTDATILAINERGAKRRGLEPRDMVGRSLESVLAPSLAVRRLEGMKESIHAGHWVDIEEVHNAKCYHVRIFPILDEAGNAVQFATFSRDVTEAVLAEKALREALAQARELTVKAEAANKTKSEFLANMSHEIRTPLNGILGMLQVLQCTPLSEDQKDFLLNAIKSADRLTRLLSDILDISVIEAGKIALQKTVFSINETCQSVQDLFAQEAAEKQLTLHCSIDSRLPSELIGDEGRLRQILFNLVGNALKFTSLGGVEMDISLVSPPGERPCRVLFSITDTGIGIPDSRISDIFEPFTQVDGSFVRRYQGAGLGLAIVRRLTRLMDGELCIVSEEGVGTSMHAVFSFGAQTQASSGLKSIVSDERIFDGGPMRILLVEDEEINKISLMYQLERGGHTVTTAENGKQALECLRQGDFEVIVMDVQMPVMDGVEATRIIRSAPEFKVKSDIPIIAVTAYAMVGDRDNFLAAGMDDYIPKPVDQDMLMEVIKRVMAKKR